MLLTLSVDRVQHHASVARSRVRVVMDRVQRKQQSSSLLLEGWTGDTKEPGDASKGDVYD